MDQQGQERDKQRKADPSGGGSKHSGILEGGRSEDAVRALPVILIGILLVASAWWDSAFDLRYWAPLTILSLALLAAQLVTGTLRIPKHGPLMVATAGIWGLVAWVMLGSLWSESAAAAWEEAARTAFYASVWTTAAGSGLRAEWNRRIGAGLAWGVALVAAAVLIGLTLGDTADQFLAGRLDSPIGYRNATACLFAFAFWPLINLAAVRGRGAAERAAAFGAASLCLSLAFLTQSRGVFIGLALGGLVSILIGPDRLRRIWLAIAAGALVALFSGSMLTPYDAFLDNDGIVTNGDLNSAVGGVIAVTVLAFVTSLFGFVFDNGLRTPDVARNMRILAAAGLVFVAVGGLTAGVARVGDPVSYLDEKIDEFNDDEPAPTSGATRLGSVGGQRADLWGVAWDQFTAGPIQGAGAGSYQFTYYRDRDTDRNLNDTHSLPLRLLADTGLIGLALFVTWAVGAGIAIGRRARRAAKDERVWIAGLAASGTVIFAQSLSDWLWLLPGLIALAMLALGLAAPSEDDASEDDPAGPRWTPLRVAALSGVALTLISVTFLFLGDVYTRKARVEAFASPQAQLSAAETAARFNPVSVNPLYLQASALETMGDEAEARAKLQDALDLEPDNFVTLGLLGDLEVRAGNQGAARDYYRQALVLNPLDIGLQELSGEGES